MTSESCSGTGAEERAQDPEESFKNVSKLCRVYNMSIRKSPAFDFLCISSQQEISKKKCLGCTIKSDKPMDTMVTFDISKANGSS